MMKPIRWGILSTGVIAKNFASTVAKMNGETSVLAVASRTKESADAFADVYGIERRYTDLDTMLAELPELDAADVCVWNCNHAECSIKALNAGLHVLCEKPMAYSAKEAEEMKAAADKNGKLLMIGFVLRFSDDAKIAMDFIQKDYLGEIYYSKAQYVRRHGNPGGWFADKSRSGGGPIIDLGVHVIDLTRYLMGNPKPVSVYAVASQRLGDRKFLKTGPGWVPEDAKEDDVCTVEDFATALIRYDNGACTFLETSYDINGEDIAKRQLFGTKGGMDLSRGVKLYTTVNDYMADIDVKTANLKGGQDMFVAEMAHFIDCVKNGTECRAKAEDGIAVMKILDAIYESARTGHEVIL